MSQGKINIAIVGLGFGAEFIPIYQRHPNANAYAICQRGESRLNAIGHNFDINVRYSDSNDTSYLGIGFIRALGARDKRSPDQVQSVSTVHFFRNGIVWDFKGTFKLSVKGKGVSEWRMTAVSMKAGQHQSCFDPWQKSVCFLIGN